MVCDDITLKSQIFVNVFDGTLMNCMIIQFLPFQFVVERAHNVLSVSKSAITAPVQEPTPVQTRTRRDNKLSQIPREPGNVRRLSNVHG